MGVPALPADLVSLPGVAAFFASSRCFSKAAFSLFKAFCLSASSIVISFFGFPGVERFEVESYVRLGGRIGCVLD